MTQTTTLPILKHTLFSCRLANIQNIKIRNIITKLRINNNNLGMSPKEKNKKCKWCNNDIYEDLSHVLIKCPKYTECRKFIKPLFNSNYDDSNTLACILNVTDENVNSQLNTKNICNFLTI